MTWIRVPGEVYFALGEPVLSGRGDLLNGLILLLTCAAKGKMAKIPSPGSRSGDTMEVETGLG